MVKESVLLVEDDVGTRELLAIYLKKREYDVTTAKNGEEALDIITSRLFHIIVLDIEMPGLDGFIVCQKIREHSMIPIIFISARQSISDKIKCFELGGDDYITKPFDFVELDARIKANLRHLPSFKKENDYQTLEYGGLKLDLATYQCTISGRPISLSTKE